MDIESLEKIGLTKNESLVYITLLKLGSAKSGEILTKSGLNSGKIYEILESLKRKGLASESIINKMRNFTPAPPSKILNYLAKKKNEIESEEIEIKKEIPELEKMRNTSIKEIKSITYLGYEGIKTAIEEAFSTLQQGEEICGMGITERKNKKFNDLWIKIGEERIKKKIKAKNLFSERGSYFEEYKKIKLTENRVLEDITPVTVDIFGEDKVLILNYNEPCSCILIYDKNTTKAFKSFFNQLWNIAKK